MFICATLQQSFKLVNSETTQNRLITINIYQSC